jgi:hypothetical protein
MIGKNLIEQIKDLYLRLNQEKMSKEQVEELNNSTIEELEEERSSLLMDLGEYLYPEFYELY